MIQKIELVANSFGRRLNWFIERLCALLAATMVIVIWIGVTGRYFIEIDVTWTEELSRYVMIWLALLAVSCCAYRREHIGLDFLLQLLPIRARPLLCFSLDMLGLAFFIFLTIFGIGMTVNGITQYATIFGMTMVVPFASVPIASCLTSIQILITMIRDMKPDATSEVAP